METTSLDTIDLNLSPDAKLRIAKDYVNELIRTFPCIDAVMVSGSTVRGTSISPSDVDMWYLVREGEAPAGVHKCIYRGVSIDIEPVPAEAHTPESLLSDAYNLGYFTGPLVLYDRSGVLSALLGYVSAHLADEPYRSIRLSKLTQPTLLVVTTSIHT